VLICVLAEPAMDDCGYCVVTNVVKQLIGVQEQLKEVNVFYRQGDLGKGEY
jgi:hypothetical protein